MEPDRGETTTLPMTFDEFEQRRRKLWREIKINEAEFIMSNARYKVGDVVKVSFPWGDRHVENYCVIVSVGIGKPDCFGLLQYNPIGGHIVYVARPVNFENGKWKIINDICRLDHLNGINEFEKYYVVCGYQKLPDELDDITMEVVDKIEMI